MDICINKLVVFILFIGSATSFAQTVTGKLISEGGSLEYVEIRNITQNKTRFSGSDGSFKIEAELGDTLSFEALFYETRLIVVDSLVLKEEQQIQLEKKQFELEEVMITAEKFTFDTEVYTENFKEQLQNDFKKRPYLYKKERGNILELASLAVEGVGKLLGIEKKEVEVITYISFEDLEKLFAEDDFFNDDLLRETLKISGDKKFSFFAFCEDQKIESRLLEAENNFLLLDKLVVLAANFRKRSEETEEGR